MPLKILRALAALAPLLVLPARGFAAETPPGIIKIGVLAEVSCSASALSLQVLNGARLAAEEANAGEGALEGRRVETAEVLCPPDTPSVIKGLRRIVDDPEIIAVVGHLEGPYAVLASSVLAENRLGFLAPLVTHPKLTQRGLNNVFRFCATDRDLGMKAAEFSIRTLKKRKIAILFEKAFNGEELAGSFKEGLWLKKVRESLYQELGAEEMDDTLVSRLKGFKPDLVFFGGGARRAGRLARRLKKSGLRVSFLGADPLLSQEFILQAGEAAAGTIVVSPYPDFEGAGPAAEFKRRYLKRFAEPMGPGAPYGYEALRLALKAIKAAGTTQREAVRSKLASLRKVSGIVGTVTFDAFGDNTRRKAFFFTVARDLNGRNMGFVFRR